MPTCAVQFGESMRLSGRREGSARRAEEVGRVRGRYDGLIGGVGIAGMEGSCDADERRLEERAESSRVGKDGARVIVAPR